MAKKQYLWKSMKAGLRSSYNNSPWEIGVWRNEKPPTEECVGLNGCPRIIDAMGYVDMEILAKVEVGGKIIKSKDKWTCEKMRVIEAYIWSKEESIRLAIFSAELVIDIYEKEYPTDDRPRRAIEAAKNWLKEPTGDAAEAAWAASTAARAAAWTAAWTASTAARAASTAAWTASTAARAASTAAWTASTAAWTASTAARAVETEDKLLDKIEQYLLSRIEHLEEYH